MGNRVLRKNENVSFYGPDLNTSKTADWESDELPILNIFISQRHQLYFQLLRFKRSRLDVFYFRLERDRISISVWKHVKQRREQVRSWIWSQNFPDSWSHYFNCVPDYLSWF